MSFNHEAGSVPSPTDAGQIDAVLRLQPTLDAPAVARRFVADHRDHLAAGLIDDAQLLVSELVSNAVKHGRTAILLRVRATPPGIGIAVSDASAGRIEPDGAMPCEDATSGRGLAIVAAIASAWGIDEADPPPGKTVWFEIAEPSGPA